MLPQLLARITIDRGMEATGRFPPLDVLLSHSNLHVLLCGHECTLYATLFFCYDDSYSVTIFILISTVY